MRTMERKVPTKAQLNLKAGDRVKVLRDSGAIELRTVSAKPWTLNGEHVVNLDGITGAYLLTRCTYCPTL